ncbi:hypothetical protein [Streptomyces sp. NPDC057494]|uniref:hypothetical protein n=1 Tax=Streptomyces sp. NPDC057494 TaxID=3346148 RepID=UPI0036CCBC89
MISTAEQLLAALEPLPHAARLRLTAVTAHRLAARSAPGAPGRSGGPGGSEGHDRPDENDGPDASDLRTLLAALDARGPYERRLAALAALTAGDLDHLAARLGDPDPVVRRYALRGARRLPVADAAVEAAYDDAPAVVRADLARLLRDGRRPALAERLALRVRTEYGDRDAALLLPGCSTEFTARLLPELAGALAPEDWSTLAVRHPVAVLDQVERELTDMPERLRDLWWRRHATGIAAALPAAPERVLDLLERYGPPNPPGPVLDRLGDLVTVDAERVARWFADPERAAARWERTPGRAIMRRLVAADPPSLPLLGVRWFHREAFRDLLRSVPPARRARFADAVVAAAGPVRNVRVHEGLLALLPPAERHARTRTRIEVVRAEPHTGWDLWGLLALLPPAEARPELLAALGTRNAEERGAVWDHLIANAGHSRDPEQIAEVLALAAGRLVNERDPVRGEALSAVAELSAPLLAAAFAAEAPSAGSAAPRSVSVSVSESVERLCLDALRARDCSDETRDTIRRLVVTLLSGDAGATAPRTALRLVEALTAHTGTVELGALGPALRGGGADAVLDVLGPWLDRATASGDTVPLLALVGSAGRRAHRIPELQHRLELALRTCPDERFGEVAAAWLADAAARGERVGTLLAQEPSAAFVPQVLAVLAAERTDLLDRALPASPPPGGRFPMAGAPRPLPPFRYADRWLPRQQEAAVRLAEAAVADTGRGLDERAALLRAVAPVPRYGRALLQRYTAPAPAVAGQHEAGRDSDAPLTAAALDAAARTDDPASALGALLDHAGDDRAAAAWSAAGRAAAHARPSHVAALLRDVLTRETGVKVTVRKTAARLAARHLPPGAATALLSTVARTPGVHPDVHATVVGLATTLLPDEAMWALLESAAADGPDAARDALLAVSPADLAPAHRARYGALVTRLALAPGDGTANQAVSGLGNWARFSPAAGTALAALYVDLAQPRNVYRAGYELTELARSGLPHPLGGVAPGSLLHGVVDRLLASVAAGEPEGGGRDGDLPARRRLRSLLDHALGDHRMCAALARQLASEPAVVTARTDLLVRAIDLDAPEPELLLALRELTAAVAGRPVLAARVAEEMEEAHRYGRPLADPGPALAAVRVLGGDGGLVEGLLAVGLATALGTRLDWPEAWRAAVVELRRHPEPDVREAAYETVVGGG